MSKNMKLNQLLANSKFAQLPKTNQLMSLRHSKAFPSAQTIETTTGSFKHRDYGLKSPLPPLDKRRRIVVDEVDTLEHMIAYERAPGDYQRKMKFNEFNVPLHVRQNNVLPGHAKNPLFFGSTTDRITEKEHLSRFRFSEVLNLAQNSPKATKGKMIDELHEQRSNFLKYLAETSPEKYIKIKKGDLKGVKIDEEIVEFLLELNRSEGFSEAKKLGKLAQNEVTKPLLKATGGLSYQLGGRLATTPNGAKRPGAVVPARLIRSKGDSYQVAVGGFVAQAPAAQMGNLLNIASKDESKHITQQMIPVHVSSAHLNANGSVQLRLEGIQFKTARDKSKNNVKIPTAGFDVNEDSIFDLLSVFGKSRDKEI